MVGGGGAGASQQGFFGPLLQQLLNGLLRQVMMLTSALTLYGAWVLTPHLREHLEGIFGKPETEAEKT